MTSFCFTFLFFSCIFGVISVYSFLQIDIVYMYIEQFPQYLPVIFLKLQFNVSQISDKLPEMSEQEAFSVNLFCQFLFLATPNNPSEYRTITKPQSIIKSIFVVLPVHHKVQKGSFEKTFLIQSHGERNKI